MPGFDPARLKALRRQKGHTQAALARIAEVPQDAVALWEAGHRVPGVANVTKIAAALEVDPLAMTDRPVTGDMSLQDLRLRAGLAQHEVAERAVRAGVALLRTTYSKVERGEKVTITGPVTTVLAGIFGVYEEEIRTAFAVSRAEFVGRRLAGDQFSD